MAQNLRTMQDDLREAKEKTKKPAFGFMQKKETIQNDLETTAEVKEKIETAPIKEEKKETLTENRIPEPIKTFQKNDILSKLQEDPDAQENDKEEPYKIETKEEIKPTNFETVLKTEEEKKDSQENIPEKKQDEEIKSLAKRISESMSSTIKHEIDKEKEKHPAEIDKDKELKELINRMSQNLQETNEELQDLTEKLNESEMQLKELQTKETEQKIEQPKTNESPITAEVEKPMQEKVPAKKGIIDTKPKNQEIAEDKPISDKANSIEPDKDNKGDNKNISYWEKLHKSIKSEQEGVTIATPEVIKEEEAKTQEGGIIAPKQQGIDIQEGETKNENDSLPETKAPQFYDKYISPENRLVFGKQEYYSSIHKKIKPKTKKESLERFKDTLKSAEQLNILTTEEEKKLLKKQIATKYHLNLNALPWKKIIIASTILLTIWGVSLAYIIPRVRQNEEETENIIAGKNIEIIEQKIVAEISASQSQVEGINYFDATIDPWKSFPDKSVIRLKITNNEKSALLTKDNALKTILKNENYEKMPQNFSDLTSEEYSILVFKNNDSLRLGLVFQFDPSKVNEINQAMSEWENINNKQQRIHNIMKTLFVNTRTIESERGFSSANYKNIELKYLNLPDTNTSMDYFVYDNIIVFTTSKDTVLEMIDIMTQ